MYDRARDSGTMKNRGELLAGEPRDRSAAE